MKKTFTTIDVLAIAEELKESIIGFRVNQVYDIDHKTYMIKLQKPDHKVVLLLESAARIHTTEYEWPKSPAPSWFSMKLRKFLRNKRLENVKQLGVDRIVDLTFGSGEAEHHLIVELYDRGNIILTDGNFNILHVLRPRKEGEDTKIITNEIYPIENARKAREAPTFEELEQAYNNAKDNTGLKKIFNPLLDCGGSVLEHELLSVGFPSGAKKVKNVEINIKDIHEALTKAQSSVREERKELEKKGYIVKKLVKRMKEDGSTEDTFLYEEFHPRLYNQHKELPVEHFPSFNKACDEYFSKLEANELDKKVVQKEREALKKLENVRKDHEKRLQELKGKQEEDMRKGQLIELNQGLVDGALLVVRSAIANQIDWKHIQELLDEAQARNDPIACAIRALKLKQNSITLWLSDPYDCDENDMLLDSDEEREHGTESEKMRPMAVDINLDLSALANARRYYNMKRQAAKKEQKTIDASYKAIKSAEKKTQQTLKEVNTIANINKARKVHWFEKFLWFVSSDNYLVIGGRDSQQNEQVVKRHLKLKDIYVHADLHGASSVVIKNPSGNTVPPRTLHEAGIMALCYSRAWDEKVVTSAWWVWGQQVSKTAPAGEYLTTGAFMVRGKKNYLPPSHLVYGFGFLFRLEESSIARYQISDRAGAAIASATLVDFGVITKDKMQHVIDKHEGERKARVLDGPDNEFSSAISAALEKLTANSDDITDDNEVIIDMSDADTDDEKEESPHEKTEFSPIKEENVESDSECKTKSVENETEATDYLSSNDNKEENEDNEDEIKEDSDDEDEFGLRSKIGAFKGIQTLDLNDESQDKLNQFPDTELKISHLKDDQFTLKAQVIEFSSKSKSSKEKYLNPQEDDAPLQGKKSECSGKRTKKNPNEKKVEREEGKKDKIVMVKRGQKGKMKKMKKYKDQDEEERELRMQILQSSGSKKPSKKESKRSLLKKGVQSKKPKPTSAPPEEQQAKKENQPHNTEEIEDNLEEEEMKQVPDDLSILNELTAIPFLEDELLYAIPVCAPYTAMTAYKFKIKLTPGPGKKGKACKTAISLFLADKTSTNREKDLLRALKDHDLAKNFPGKVKVSAPNINKIKK